ncbi:MAG: response regulator [Spirochaetes bacterium]|nr:response regulator [Spirochaetota bacterium]
MDRKNKINYYELEEIFKAIVNSSDGFIYVCSKDHIIEYMSPKLIDRIGYDGTGKPCYKVLHELEDICPWCKDTKVFEGETQYWEIKSPKDNKWYKVLNSPIYHKDGSFSKLMIINDITEKKKENAADEKNDRLKLLSLMASGMAHDFNNLLTGILGYISLLKLPVVSFDDFKKYIENAEEGCKKARRLVNQLLAFSKGMPLTKEKVNLKILIEEITNFILSGKPYNCDITSPDDLWEIFADKIQIEQILQNLIINAVQAMPRGGNIVITLENIQITNYYELNANPGNYVRLTFKDFGKGISKSVLERIFDPFFTTKKDGSGLGLAIIQEIVKKHDGIIKVESELNKGTQFIIYLPISIQSNTLILEDFLPENTKTTKILIMDDDPMILSLCKEMIMKMGHKTETAKDGKKAEELIKSAIEKKDPFEILITDMIVVDGIGGVELIKKAKQIAPDIKIIIASAYCEDFNNDDNLRGKVNIFLKKPYTFDELKKAVNNLL